MVLVLVRFLRPRANARSVPEEERNYCTTIVNHFIKCFISKKFYRHDRNYVVRANFSFHSLQIQNVVENHSGIRAGDRRKGMQFPSSRPALLMQPGEVICIQTEDMVSAICSCTPDRERSRDNPSAFPSLDTIVTFLWVMAFLIFSRLTTSITIISHGHYLWI